ncbi:MAG: flagellar protein FlaG [Aquificaceae bacterium]
MRIGNTDFRLDMNLDPGYIGLTEKLNLQKLHKDKMYAGVFDTDGNTSEGKRAGSEELQKLMEEIKRKFDMLSKYLRIDIDRELEIPVAKIIEKDTNRIIRQIPPEYLLELMKRIDQMLGVLLQKEV